VSDSEVRTWKEGLAADLAAVAAGTSKTALSRGVCTRCLCAALDCACPAIIEETTMQPACDTDPEEINAWNEEQRDLELEYAEWLAFGQDDCPPAAPVPPEEEIDF